MHWQLRVSILPEAESASPQYRLNKQLLGSNYSRQGKAPVQQSFLEAMTTMTDAWLDQLIGKLIGTYLHIYKRILKLQAQKLWIIVKYLLNILMWQLVSVA